MRSNCILWAVPRWIAKGRQEQCKYLVIPFGKWSLCFRWSRIPWGILHCLLGEMDPVTGQISVQSYKPPLGHKKTGLALTFKGQVVEGDSIIRWVEMSEDVPGTKH